MPTTSPGANSKLTSRREPPRRCCTASRGVTAPFCGACDRIRLTPDGQLRNCLFAHEESDLRGPLRDGATDDELTARIMSALAAKRAGHGIDDPSFLQPSRPMSAIGG